MGRFRPHRMALPRYESGVPGLPARAMAFTNSEVSTAGCKTRWWFSYGLRLGTETNSAMYFGSKMHQVLEYIFEYWKERGEPFMERHLACSPDDDGSLAILEVIHQELVEEGASEEEAVEFIDKLRDCAVGYLKHYGTILKDYQVLAVELPVAMPVVNPKTGKTFVSGVPIVEEAGGYRLAMPGEKGKVVRLPWYKVGRLDGVVMEKATGDLWVWEFKTSKSATTYGKNLALDTQLPGYALALETAFKEPANAHLFPPECSGRVRGYIWDVLGSNEHKRPRRLKSGKLSTAEQRVPSWIWYETLSKENANMYTVEEMHKLEEQARESVRRVDLMLYHREWDHFNNADLRRYQAELYSKARMLAAMRRAVSTCEPTAWGNEMAQNFERTPLCRMPGGYCSFTSVCMNDNESSRLSFTQKVPILWPSENAPEPSKQGVSDQWQI